MDLYNKLQSVQRSDRRSSMEAWLSTYNTPFTCPRQPFPGPPIGVLVPKGMDEHGDATSNVAQEDNGSKISKNVLGGCAKARPDLTRAIVSGALLLGNGQWFSTRALNRGLDQVLLLLSVDDAVPGGTANEGDEEDEGIEILGIAEDDVGEGVVIAAEARPGRRAVVGEDHGELGSESEATSGKERKPMEAATDTLRRGRGR